MTLRMETRPGQKARSPQQDEPRAPFSPFSLLCFLKCWLYQPFCPDKSKQFFMQACSLLVMVKIFWSISSADHQHIVAESPCAQPGSLPIASSPGVLAIRGLIALSSHLTSTHTA